MSHSTATSLRSLAWAASAVTERAGGVSGSPYASLNLGLHVGDVAEKVIENRRRAAQSLGFRLEQMVCAEQIHGSAVAVAGPEMAGRGATASSDALPGVDALVTDTPGLLLTLFYADCVPVLLADPVRRVVAAAHAGWKGIVAGVVENTIMAMQSAFRTEAVDIVAQVGPGIGSCCFDVGHEVAIRFPSPVVTDGPEEGKARIDLSAAVVFRLAAAGVATTNISVRSECTSCLPERFFSYRRDNGITGRMAAMIGIRHIT